MIKLSFPLLIHHAAILATCNHACYRYVALPLAVPYLHCTMSGVSWPFLKVLPFRTLTLYMFEVWCFNCFSCPFAACNPSLCRAKGRGLQPKGLRIKETAEFKVYTKGAGTGDLKVTIKGPSKWCMLSEKQPSLSVFDYIFIIIFLHVCIYRGSGGAL